MKEQNFDKGKQRESQDLEQRLTAYYGPQLHEQPLSQTSWQNLRLRLGPQKGSGRRPQKKHSFRWYFSQQRARAGIPMAVQDAFSRITYEAHIPFNLSILRCSLEPQVREPTVAYPLFGKPTIRLRLPLSAITTMGQAELDVLLATGLARSISGRKPPYTLYRLLPLSLVLMASITLILLFLLHLPFIGLLIALALYTSSMLLWHIQARSIAFRADTLVVLWLGRSRVCSGLHALADHSRMPRRRRWGEPSLAERIDRVCGARVDARNDQLTLVR